MSRWAGLLLAAVAALVWFSGENLADMASATLEVGGVLTLFCAVCAAEALS